MSTKRKRAALCAAVASVTLAVFTLAQAADDVVMATSYATQANWSSVTNYINTKISASPGAVQ